MQLPNNYMQMFNTSCFSMGYNENDKEDHSKVDIWRARIGKNHSAKNVFIRI